MHLGGAVQYLFGIRSQVVEQNDDNIVLRGMMNEYWVKPSTEETPRNVEIVENSRYW